MGTSQSPANAYYAGPNCHRQSVLGHQRAKIDSNVDRHCLNCSTRTMPGVRPGGRPTSLASPREVGQRRRPGRLAPAGSVAVLAIQGPRPTHCAPGSAAFRQGARSQSLMALRACPELLCSSPSHTGRRVTARCASPRPGCCAQRAPIKATRSEPYSLEFHPFCMGERRVCRASRSDFKDCIRAPCLNAA